MDIKLIDRKQEQLLSNTLANAIKDVNSGVDANTSIAKYAMSNNLGPEFAGRLVEAFNTSKTLFHLKTAAADQRAESFNLADTEEVLRIMYGGEKKAACSKKKSHRVKRDYNKKPSTTAASKQASRTVSLIKPNLTKHSSQYTERQVNRLRSNIGMLKKAEDEVRAQFKWHKYLLKEAAQKVVQHMRYAPAYRSSFESAEGMCIQSHGEVVKKAMDIVWSLLPTSVREHEKRASATTKVNIDGETAEVFNRYVGILHKLAEVSAEMESFEKKAALVCKHIKDELTKLAANPNDLTTTIDTPVEPPFDFRPFDEAGSIIDEYKLPEEEPKELKMMPASHDARLRGVRTKLLVNDMISNDPVIAQYPVEDVLNAYNAVSAVAPAMATQPIIARNFVVSLLQRGGMMDSSEFEKLFKSEDMARKLRIFGL